jgi:hypothetical protein
VTQPALGLQVENVFRGPVHSGQVPARAMHDDLGLAGGARRVEEIERVLGVERLGLAVASAGRHGVLPPHVAARPHWTRRRLLAADDDGVERGHLGQRGVDLLLHGAGRVALKGAVDGDQRGGLRGAQLLVERLRGRAEEDHVVGSADSRTGEHGHRQLRHHRHVDRDDIPGADAPSAQARRQRLHLAQELRVGHRPLLSALSVPVVGDPLAAAGPDVAIQAVVGGVQPSADEPAVARRVRLVQHGVPWRHPVEQLLGLAPPPALEVALRLLIDGVVGDQRLGSERRRRLERRHHEQPLQLALERLAEQGSPMAGGIHHATCSLRPAVTQARNSSAGSGRA